MIELKNFSTIIYYSLKVDIITISLNVTYPHHEIAGKLAHFKQIITVETCHVMSGINFSLQI
jgi:hypothetical protein